VSAELLERLAVLAAERTGFRLEAVDRRALQRLLDAWVAEGSTEVDLVQRLATSCPTTTERLLRAVSIGETYFFRHQEQFEFVAREFARRAASTRLNSVRAWSAGCATGEEAYSLAAALLAHLPPTVEISVIGTDLLEANVERAERGVYGRWSLRGPIAYPSVRVASEDRLEVSARLREITSFKMHNLLDEPPPEVQSADVVFCRNVLVYFAPDTARRARGNLLRSLAPDGVLVFGAVDLAATPDGLVSFGPAQLAAYARAPKSIATPAPTPTFVRATPPALAEPSFDPIEVHVRALHCLETGARDEARRLLDGLLSRVPRYLPALLERALLDARAGDRARASRRMQELLAALDALPEGSLVEGPEALSVEYYRAAARAFLGNEGRA
jgi:chemotaxis methyl-accepting protein methylase